MITQGQAEQKVNRSESEILDAGQGETGETRVQQLGHQVEHLSHRLSDATQAARQRLQDVAGPAAQKADGAFRSGMERYPYVTLLGAAATGYLLGRTTRGVKLPWGQIARIGMNSIQLL